MTQTPSREPLHVLKTKLFRPRPTGDLLHRTRLHETLNAYLDGSVTLVSAPAGFGKTTMLSDWLEQSPCLSAWLSLDEGDSEVAVFLTYFVAAVRTVFPGACADTLALLRASALPPLGTLATALANDLEALGEEASSLLARSACERFVLVLDDYHLVRESEVHALLAQLLRHPPRTLHLVVSARHDPAFLDSALRARGSFSEIRGAELRFTPEETAAFMQQSVKTRLNPEMLETLVNSTEGWSTGLRLSALTLKAGGELLAPELVSYNRYTLDYLVTEVLAHVPVVTHDFLLKTSILDRLCGPLCDVIAPPIDPEWDGRAYLHWLASENIFTFSLDAQGHWYRYHHVFQKLLQAKLARQLDHEAIVELRRRAAAWYAERGLILEAIQHSMAAGDELAAARLVEKHATEAINWEQWRQLEQWLGLLPQPLTDARPGLLLLKAWLVQKQWRLQDLPAYLDRIEALLEQDGPRDPEQIRIGGEVNALRCTTAYYSLQPHESVACAERALAALPMACSAARGLAWSYIAVKSLLAGNARGAADVLHQALEEDRLHGNFFPIRPYVNLCHLHIMTGDLASAFVAATQLLQVGQQRKLNEGVGWGYYFRGCVLYLQHQLESAEAEFSAVFRLRYATHGHPFSQGAFGLILTLSALGKAAEACDVLDALTSFGVEANNRRVIGDAQALRAWLAQRSGAVAEAQHWATTLDANLPLVPMTTLTVPHLVRVRILVAEGSAPSLLTATQELTRLREQARSSFNLRYQCEILALEALVCDARNDRGAAFDYLRQALELGEPGRLVRSFVDSGPGLGRLLTQFAQRYGPTEYRRQLLAAFADDAAALSPAATPASIQSVGGQESGLIERLSRRELDVLWLLSRRYTDKEIARELSISSQTVKRHAANIYQKLDVGNRRDAVERAAAYGLLTSPPDFVPPPGERHNS
jgi:LuxR family maltose regulon positive regulatory protein